ncbi:hypothetical protein ACHAXH_001878 [Discostella pseudostelligera]
MPEPLLSGLKARLARTFLNFLDEHGNYRSALEEAAARAAAAEANSLWARDRRGRNKKKKRKYGGKLNDGEMDDEDDDDDDLWEELELPPVASDANNNNMNKHPPLPDDPYEQIQFYFATFTQRTKLQLHQQLEYYQTQTQNWLHEELHHVHRVPLFSASMLLTSITLYTLRRRSKKLRHMIRVHSILGKKFTLKEYIHANIIRGYVFLEHSLDGSTLWKKLADKANKAEMAALASMTPHQRTKFERFVKLEYVGEQFLLICLLLGMMACGFTLMMSLTSLWKGGIGGDGDGDDALIGPIDSMEGIDGLMNTTTTTNMEEIMRELAEERYNACVTDAEFGGVEDPNDVCIMDTFLDLAMSELGLDAGETVTTTPVTIDDATTAPSSSVLSPLRSKINRILITKLGLPSSFANYLTSLRTQTIAYLTSFVTFLLFLLSHYLAHKLHTALMHNDPMKHFVLSSDATVKADGTVEAKRGETEAQRKRRERMMQAERLKAQMAQLAMEAKQAVEARRQRLEGDAAVEKEKEQEQKKQSEEQEEIVRMHSKQYMMIKAGVPEVAIMNTLLAEGIEEEDERKEIIDKLRTIKNIRAEEAQRAEEAEAKRLELEKKQEEEKEHIAQERLRLAKAQKGTVKRSFSSNGTTSATTPKNDGGDELKKRLYERKISASSIVSAPPIGEGSSNSNLSTAVSAKSNITSSFAAPSPAAAAIAGALERKGSSSLKGIPPKTPTPPSSRRDSLEATGSGSTAKSLADTTPKKSNIILSPTSETNAAPNVANSLSVKSNQAEKSGEASVSEKFLPPPMPSIIPIANAKSTDGGSSDSRSSSPPPVLVRISSSPDGDELQAGGMLTSWSERPSARDILATITAVENAPDEEEVNVVVEGSTKTIDLSPSWLHTPAFERAVRNSNASWDRRPSSRDVMAKIRAVELLEAKQAEKSTKQSSGTSANDRPTPRRGGARTSSMVEESLGIINEGNTTSILSPTSFDVKQKVSKSGSAEDDEISELSEPTYQSLEQRAFKGRSIPQSLYVPQSSDAMTISPMVSSTSFGLSPYESRKPILSKDKLDKMAQMAEEGTLDLPAMPDVTIASTADEIKEEDASTVVEDTANKTDSDNVIVVPVAAVVKETEEQKQRRLKAVARAKKIEAIAARRNAGEDDDESAVSGLSKRLRTRRKKKVQLASISQEDCSVKTEESQKSDEKLVASVKVESEEEKQRKMRAEARAKKLEAIAASRNTGVDVDDDTAVSGISKRHRIRRKKSALAAITPEERERNEWKKSVYGFVMNAEQVQWRNSIYSHILNAETTRAKNMDAKRELDEQNSAAQRRRENKERLEQKAKKFAARAERFHKSRLEGGADDDGGSVISSASMSIRRRNHRKSSARQSLAAAPPPLVEEPAVATTESLSVYEASPAVLTEVEKENLERNQWCSEVYATALNADQNLWKKDVFNHVLNAEEERIKRMEVEAKIEEDRAIALALKENERKNELRSKKMEQLKLHRDADTFGEGDSSIAASEEDQGRSVAAATTISAKPKWKNRRKKAANKK